MNEKENGIIVSNRVIEMIPLSCNTVLNDIEENGLEMWNHCITNEFPISEVIRKGNEVILNIGSPHNGFVIESVMNDGKLNGKAIMKNDKGVLIGEFVYVNGEANGSCKLYNENGVLYFEGYLKNGYREGMGKEYDIEGNVIFEGLYKEGKRTNIIAMKEMKGYFKELNGKGELLSICEKNNKCENDGICYLYLDGAINKVSKWKDGKEISIIKKFNGLTMSEFVDGVMLYKGGYLNTIESDYARHGMGEEYGRKGCIVYEGEYDNGK